MSGGYSFAAPPISTFLTNVAAGKYVASVRAGLPNAIPGVWLLLYGTGVITGGMYSVKVVPIMGICLMVLGALALFSSPAFANWFRAAGFGVLHLVFGAIIVRKYGG